MKKKIFALCLCIAMIAIAVVGGTLAYFTDEAAQTNTMTLGSVEIEQLEYQRIQDEDGKFVEGVAGTDFTADYGITRSYKLEEFEQDKPAFPVVGGEEWDEFQQLWNGVGAPGSNQIFSMPNVVDKFVFVENTGKSEAYFRTIILVESPSAEHDKLIHVNVNNNSRYDYNGKAEGNANNEPKPFAIWTINGTRFQVISATHTEPLLPDEIARPSLLQLHLDHAATNEDVAAFGDKWEVLTLSQAVQVQGFEDANTALDTAFGEVTQDNVTDWFFS